MMKWMQWLQNQPDRSLAISTHVNNDILIMHSWSLHQRNINCVVHERTKAHIIITAIRSAPKELQQRNKFFKSTSRQEPPRSTIWIRCHLRMMLVFFTPKTIHYWDHNAQGWCQSLLVVLKLKTALRSVSINAYKSISFLLNPCSSWKANIHG